MAAASSGGHGGCPEGIPVEFALLSILAAFGVAFGVLYRALTLTTAKRRKRSLAKESGTVDQGLPGSGTEGFKFADVYETLMSPDFGEVLSGSADLIWQGKSIFRE